MSFTREVVTIVHENGVIDAKKNITNFMNEINHFEEKVQSFITLKYVEFLNDLIANDKLLDEGNQLYNRLQLFLDNIENETKAGLVNSSEELQYYLEELHELTLGMKINLKILALDDLCNKLADANQLDDQLKKMNLLNEMKTLIYDSNDNVFNKLDCYSNIKNLYQSEYQMMLLSFRQKFEYLVNLNERNFQNTKQITIKVSKDEKQLHEIFIGLVNTKYNPKSLCEFLLDNLFEPIITKPVSIEYDEEGNADFVVLTLSFNIKQTNTNLRPNYKVVFPNIEKAVTCLTHLNSKLSDDRCVFTIFADYIKEKFFKLLTDECLLYAIPDTMDEMTESTIKEDIRNLNNFLVENGFIFDIDNTLLDFINKIDHLFENRFCTNIIDTSVKIMQKDLHDMIVVPETNEMYSKFMISKSIVELRNLLEQIIKQAEHTSSETSDQLYATISKILERYLITVPAHHSKLLQNIPQPSALFHNNNIYLGMWLEKNTNISDYGMIAINLEREGMEQLAQQVKYQNSILMDILKEFQLNETITELGPEPFKTIRKCLRQLDLLKNVWQTVLPHQIYNKTMGGLLNDVVNEIIRKMLALEDIPTQVSNGLIEICKIIIERSPSIFEDPLDVSLHVKSWMKLIQLKMILGASLIEITEQWSERKGPLALNYKPDEVKHLIRALFQNTDRRANALALIG